MGHVLYQYLGLSIRGNSGRLLFWDPVMHTIISRLSALKIRVLSFGGHLTLLKFDLTSLPVYALSFFKAWLGIISSIESLFKNLFCGGSEDHRKIPWIGWNIVCLRKENGGLGVMRLREFNSSLLGKLCWRMLVDRDGFWYRVLAARYGEEAGSLQAGDQSGSYWWREVARIRDGVGERTERVGSHGRCRERCVMGHPLCFGATGG